MAKKTTKLIKVYRLEDSQGRGPYNGETVRLYAMAKTHNKDGELRHRTPTPEEDDFSGLVSHEDYFGFESLGALFEWFDGYAQSLHEQGFFAAVYEVDDKRVKRGRRQLTFVKDEATFSGRIDLGCESPSRSDHRSAVQESDARQAFQRILPTPTETQAKRMQAQLYANGANPYPYVPIQPRWVDEVKKIDDTLRAKAREMRAAPAVEGKTGLAGPGKIKMPGGDWNEVKEAKPEPYRVRLAVGDAELMSKGFYRF